MLDGVGTTVYGYDAAGQLVSEAGPWASDTVNYTYQNRLRQSLSVAAPNGAAWTQTYGYDSARRLKRVASPAGPFNYTYDAVALQRVDELSLPNGASITNSFGRVARLTGTWLINSGGTNLDAYAYGYNQANERTNVVRTAGDDVNYTYDNAGELLTATGREPSGSLRLQERLIYAYDGAGNLQRKRTSASSYSQTVYGLNTLNEITNATLGAVISGWAGTVTVAGSTTSPATNVAVNGTSVALYGDHSFAWNFAASSGLNTYTAMAQDIYGRVSTNTTAVTVIPTNNAYAYDLNGNLLADGTRNFAYDDENQLISVWQTNAWRSDFVYDGKMRRRITREYAWNTGTAGWQQTNEIHYLYDGNLVVQERAANNLPLVTYTRGIDLSGTLLGAGGIGGLLARTDNAKLNIADPFASAYYHCDGNGNVTCLINAYQQIAAKYLYDPYGNMLAMYGVLAEANTYRFSSKEWNANAGLYYYLYRFYDPSLQRWLNRDPIGEIGFELVRMLGYSVIFQNEFSVELITDGVNLYIFADNMLINVVDIDGLWFRDVLWPWIKKHVSVRGSGKDGKSGKLSGGGDISCSWPQPPPPPPDLPPQDILPPLPGPKFP